MTLYEELLRKMQTGEAKVLKPISGQLEKSKPRVSSIYDVMPFGDYEGVPLVVIFHQDIGYFRWCMEKFDNFCIQEWAYLKDATTRNPKKFIPKELKYEFGQEVYDQLQPIFSDEEILVFLGGHSQVHNPIFNAKNDEKLKRFGLEPTRPKLFDRTYFSFARFTFPRLSGQWIYEKSERSAKGTGNITFFRAADENASYATDFINKQIALIDINDFYTLLDENGNNVTDGNKMKEGDVFEATTNSSGDARYTFIKIK